MTARSPSGFFRLQAVVQSALLIAVLNGKTGFDSSAVVFADDDFALALELVLAKERIDERRGEKLHSAFDAVRRHGEVVVDPLFARRAVELGAELRRARDEIVRVRDTPVFALKNMCSYRCDSPSYSGACVNEPFLTSASIVTSGTPRFSTTITSSPFGSVCR